MDKIFVKLLGIPAVSINGEKVVFPSRKVEALFYYLVINKEAGREEIAALLWPEAGAEAGRKNLRNAIYYVKKSFDMDVIISPKKSTIMLNPDIYMETDTDRLTGSDEWEDAYSGEFLQGFTVKEEEALEEWIAGCRERYKSLYGQKLYIRLKQDFEAGDYAAAEQSARRLTSIDPYDEKAYRAMMKAYVGMELHNKAIDYYNRLSDLLQKELGIVPDSKTKALYSKILEARNRKETVKDTKGRRFFFGRKNEMDKLRYLYGSYREGMSCGSAIIIGEAGIGKTGLKDRVIEDIRGDSTIILEANCYQAEAEFPLKPWSTIFEGVQEAAGQTQELASGELSGFFQAFTSYSDSMGDIKFKLLEDKVIGLLRKLSRIKKVVLVFDDIQWMDSLSITLLTGILLHLHKEIFVIMTGRKGFSQRIDNFISETVRYERLTKIELERFTKEEVGDFIREALPEKQLSSEMQENIFKETEGNTFFLVEYLNSLRENKESDVMSSKMADILKSRFIGIGETGMKLVNIISMFYDEAPLEILAEISGMEDSELVDVLDDLKLRYIIREARDRNKLGISFTHQKLRDFIYIQLSEVRKQVIHGRIAKSIEAGLTGDERDAALYAKLIYHYRNSGNHMAALKYSIRNANYYLDFYHELFPVLGKGPDWENSVPVLGSGDALKYIYDIEELLERVKEAAPSSDELSTLEIAFCHLKGRYLIRQGNYEAGVALIRQMIADALDKGLHEYVMKGHRQMIYYGIQTRRLELIRQHADSGLKLAKAGDFIADMGMFLRLKGLYLIMVREYDKAEELLKQCISTFQSVKEYAEKYAMHIAGAYSYIGDIRRYGMKFQSSLDYYDKAIELCEDRKVLTSQTVFCTHAGQAAFDAGDYVTARAYFKKALNTFGQADSIWGRGTAEGYTALLNIREGAYLEALQSLRRADKYSSMIKNPYEQGLIFRIKAEISSGMKSNRELAKVFEGYLDKDTMHYCREGLELLKEANDRYQLDIIKIFADGRNRLGKEV